MAGIEFPAALGLAEMDPVGGAVAGAVEARGLAEGLEQDGADAVALVPVAGELALEAGEQMGGQGGEADPGQDEVAGVIDDEGQVALAGGGIPGTFFCRDLGRLIEVDSDSHVLWVAGRGPKACREGAGQVARASWTCCREQRAQR